MDTHVPAVGCGFCLEAWDCRKDIVSTSCDVSLASGLADASTPNSNVNSTHCITIAMVSEYISQLKTSDVAKWVDWILFLCST